MVLSLSALLVSCGGGGGGGGSSSSGGQTAVLVSGAPADEDLCSLSVTVTSITLVDDGGRETANLLAGPAAVDLLGLSGQHVLLSLVGAPAGTYVEVRAAIDPQSVQARDVSGNPVEIPVTRDSTSAAPAHPIVLDGRPLVPVNLEVPVLDCLVDRGSGREFQFVIGIPDLNSDAVLDVVVGRVTQEFPGQNRFVIEAVRGDDDAPVGPITVVIDSRTVLLDRHGEEFGSSAQFFDALEEGALVEVHGQLRPDATLLADSVEIDDNDEDGHGRPVAQIEGTVLRLDLDHNLLVARIDHIKSGADHVRDAIGDDPTFTVTWDSSTVFVDHDGRRDDHGHHDDRDEDNDKDKHKKKHDDGRHDDGGDDDQGGDDNGDDGDGHGSASENDLAVGERLEMKFLDFVSPPFLAHKIQIEDRRPEFAGTVHDIDDLPHSFVVHLDPSDPAVIGGLVASSDTDVHVTLANLRSVFLDLPEQPDIDVSRLLVDQRVHVLGQISGDPSAPTIDATTIRVDPGELFGTIETLDADTHQGTLEVTRIERSFGGPPLPDPLPFVFARSMRFCGAAQSERELDDLFRHLEPGEHLTVRALGLADADGAKLYDLRSEVTRDH